MLASQLSFTARQVNSIDRFLLDGTGRALQALEDMFGLKIDSSDSSIEIAPALSNENLKHLGNGSLYIVSSDMLGDVQGKMLLAMRADDFKQLSEVVRPILSLLFLSEPNTDLAALENQKPNWMKEDGTERTKDADFQAQMMDTLAELGNILFGLYTKAFYGISELNTHHSVPQAVLDPDQQALKQALSATELPEQLHVVIENEFVILDRPIKLWCLISPTQSSLEDILKRIDSNETYH